jgi:hypothetical protein
VNNQNGRQTVGYGEKDDDNNDNDNNDNNNDENNNDNNNNDDNNNDNNNQIPCVKNSGKIIPILCFTLVFTFLLVNNEAIIF